MSQFAQVDAMVQQALAEARTRGARRVTALHLTMYDASPEVLDEVSHAVEASTAGTCAQGAQLVMAFASSRFICWDCCGLRYEAPADNPVCPNCGGVGFIVPPDIVFALDHVETE